MPAPNLNRRDFLLGSAALGATALTAGASTPFGKAEHCIFLWLGGGMAQIDTFDPKALGNPSSRAAGSAYDSIPTAVPGVRVCRHLERSAQLMDRMTAVRTTSTCSSASSMSPCRRSSWTSKHAACLTRR